MPTVPNPDDPPRAERPHSAADLFADALERPPEEREEFLRQACAGDPALLAEVESLLRAHARMEAASGEVFALGDRERAGPDGEAPA